MEYKAKHICVEGIDGVGKTGQVNLLNEALNSKGIKSIVTSEPGNKHNPLTMELRKIILDAKWSECMTHIAREYLFQAARNINLHNVVLPALEKGQYVISDRGILSGIAYELAIGIPRTTLDTLFRITTTDTLNKLNRECIYDMVIILEGDIEECLTRAARKKEFIQGDAIESRGSTFMNCAQSNMKELCAQKYFPCPMIVINTTGKNIQQIHSEIMSHI